MRARTLALGGAQAADRADRAGLRPPRGLKPARLTV